MTSAGTSAGTDAGTEGPAGASLLPPTKPGPCRALPPTPEAASLENVLPLVLGSLHVSADSHLARRELPARREGAGLGLVTAAARQGWLHAAPPGATAATALTPEPLFCLQRPRRVTRRLLPPRTHFERNSAPFS